ncbi:hypothetical protein [Limnoglobus roseus]|uniref:Uncharacterized protein n=1 Tax=Limnoglobus roseus TaxID=2598579 RepID=A0A5C1AJH1_9BACT|nr:hypothetical protein [Limnoglobus roseus]QEL18317.1 hypothetical protein PX52LOC_05338 [Limnoglobus roseus]
MPSDKVLRGNATPVADVWTYTVTDAGSGKAHGVAAGSGKVIALTLGSGETTASAAAKLQGLLAASPAGEFYEYSWAANGAVVTGTAKVAGVPGVFTGAFTALAATLTNSTPAKGPNFFNDPKNYTGGTLPVDGDRIVLDENSPDALYGLTWLRDGPVVPAKIETENFTGSIGLPPVRGASNTFSTAQGATYPEYRERFLQLAAGVAEVNVGRGESDTVPALVNLDLDGDDVTLSVYGGTVNVQGTTGHPRLAVSQGLVTVAGDVGSTGGFLDVLIGDEGDSGTDAKVVFGDGATVPLVHNQSGESESSATVTSLEMGLSATSHRQTDGNCTATQFGGLIDFRSDGTLTVTATGIGTTVDFSRDPRPKGLASSSSFRAGAKFLDPANTRTSGSGATYDQTSLPLSKLGASVPVVKP